MATTRRPGAALVAALLVAAALGACGAEPTAPGAPVASSAAAADGTRDGTAAGRYVSLAEYEKDPAAYADTTVVLFFHAPWCPSCRATESAVRADGLPAGLTLVKVDFDTAIDLRQRHGVTTQHTFVQVDPDGDRLARWTGSEDGAAILAETV